MNPTRPNRIAIMVVTVGIAGLVLMLGLWQQVDTACSGGGFDPADPVGTCQPPGPAEVGRVSADPVTVSR